MSKVVVFGLYGHGHVNPTFHVVKELIRRGEEVVYYCTSEFRSNIISMGAEFREYPFQTSSGGKMITGLDESLGSNKLAGMKELNRWGQQIMQQMNVYFQIMDNPNWDLKQEMRAMKPDYMIHDSFALWGKVLAKHLHIPAIASVVIFAYCDAMLEKYPEFVMGKILNLPDPDRIDPVFIRKAVRRVSKMIGDLTDIEDYDLVDRLFCQEPLNIVFTSKEFQWFGELFDSRFKFVGTTLFPGQEYMNFPFDRLTGADLIYITLGTILIHAPTYPDFCRKCFAAFGDSDKQVVLIIGKHNPEELGEIPRNFIIRDYVPQPEIMKRARLVVTHGGMSTVNDALYYNVPMIVIPHQWEQVIAAERVAGLGAGINLKDQDFSAPELADAAEQILHQESFRENAKIIGASLRTAGGYQAAVDEIFRFKQAHAIK